MRGLERTEDANSAVYLHKTTPRESVRDKEHAGRRSGPEKGKSGREPRHVEKMIHEVWADLLPRRSAKSFPEYVRELLSYLDGARGEAVAHEKADDVAEANIDLSFGVEQLNYKNMWKVLQTAVREIGEIKKAGTGRFFLGVVEPPDKVATLMEFNSIDGYLEKEAAMALEAILWGTADGPTGRIVANPAVSLDAQANIVPEVVLHLLRP